MVKSKKRKTYKPVIPKELDLAWLSRLEEYGLSRLDTRSMAALLNCTEEEIDDRRRADRIFDQAILRGRARAVDSAARVVIAAMQGAEVTVRDAQGNVVRQMVNSEMLEAAKFYLEKHAPNWLQGGSA